MGITVLEGDFKTSNRITAVPGGITYFENLPGQLFPPLKNATVSKIELQGENVGSDDNFSPLWGFIGQEAIGPMGLLLGANAKKSRRIIYFKCILEDGRYFVGSTSAREYQKFRDRVLDKPLTTKQQLHVAIVLLMFAAAAMLASWTMPR